MKIKNAAKIFSSNSINQFADGDFAPLSDVADEFLADDPTITNYADVFSAIYALLSKQYRWEYYYKNVIANKVLLGKHSTNTATMLSEFRVGQSKADCVILNGVSTCYEIKTAFDSLNRLPEQLNNYSKLFDFVNVVTCEQHLDKVLGQIEPHIGVLILNKRSQISVKRHATQIQTDIDINVLIRSLRQHEAIEIYQHLEGKKPTVGNTKLLSTCSESFARAEQYRLRELFRNILKKSRKNHHNQLELLPQCLVNAAVSYKLSTKTLHAFIANLAEKPPGRENVLPCAQSKAV